MRSGTYVLLSTIRWQLRMLKKTGKALLLSGISDNLLLLKAIQMFRDLLPVMDQPDDVIYVLRIVKVRVSNIVTEDRFKWAVA